MVRKPIKITLSKQQYTVLDSSLLWELSARGGYSSLSVDHWSVQVHGA